MIFEIVSAVTEQGIIKGTDGFCPIAVTKGMPSVYIKTLFKIADRQVKEVARLSKHGANFYSYFPLKLDRPRPCHLLTRGTFQGKNNNDYVVHQILIDKVGSITGGPAAFLSQAETWITCWSAKAQVLKPRDIPVGQPLSPRICENWERITGDSGWAGIPLEATEGKKSCILLTTNKVSSEDVLKLMLESQSLIPASKRWGIPMAISAWQPFGNKEKFWLALERGTQAAVETIHRADVTRFDLTQQTVRAIGKYSDEARSGVWTRFGESDESDLVKREPAESVDGLQLAATSEEKWAEVGSQKVNPVEKRRNAETVKTKAVKKAGKESAHSFKNDYSFVRTGILAAVVLAAAIAGWIGIKTINSTTEALNTTTTAQTSKAINIRRTVPNDTANVDKHDDSTDH